MSRSILEEVLGKRHVKQIWATGYNPALPVTPQDFSLGGILPAVLYMMRWGHRRGKGKFSDAFGDNANVRVVASILAKDSLHFSGFGNEVEQDILADLLLAYCLENRGRKTGREEPVRRVFPTHYFSSWVDLPDRVANLRSVPEMFMALVGDQKNGSVLTPQQDKKYSVGSGFKTNLLLRSFGAGTFIDGESNSLRSDRFDERTTLGVDQLLGVRIAQGLGEAPTKLSGDTANIPNQHPVALRASSIFCEDFDMFFSGYGLSIPRQALLPIMEACISLGLTTIFLATQKLLLEWASDGSVHERESQASRGLFVDCSVSTDDRLRRYSEESVDDVVHKLSRFATCAVCLRVLDQWAEEDRTPGLPAAGPDPTDRINFLGDLMYGRLQDDRGLSSDLRRSCNKIADALKEHGDLGATAILENGDVHPAWRLAECVVFLMGEKLHGKHFRQFFDSSMLLDQPNGLARKRRTTVNGKSIERRSLVLTNTVIDYLVHRHLVETVRSSGTRGLSLNDFIQILKDRYGFYVDESPDGMSIPVEQLRKNRAFLEKRLRDLGLFVGVNDAEAMKRLKPRFEVNEDAE